MKSSHNHHHICLSLRRRRRATPPRPLKTPPHLLCQLIPRRTRNENLLIHLGTKGPLILQVGESVTKGKKTLVPHPVFDIHGLSLILECPHTTHIREEVNTPSHTHLTIQWAAGCPHSVGQGRRLRKVKRPCQGTWRPNRRCQSEPVPGR